MNAKKQPEQDEPQFFVSRRGRRVGVHEVDLSGIDIESEPTAPVAPSEEPSPQPKRETKQRQVPPKKEPRQRRTVTRRAKLVTLGFVIALLAVPFAIGELVAAEYRTGSDQARQQLDQLVQQKVLPLQKKDAASADQLRTTARDVDAIAGSMCKGGLLDNMAGLYPRAASALDECKTSQRSYAALVGSLYELESVARYLESLATELKTVTTPITDEYAVVGVQRAAWQDAADGLKKMSPPAKMKSAHQNLQQHVEALATAWRQLDAANNEQDADSFTEAEKAMSGEYEAIRSASAGFLEVIRDSQASVNAAYQRVK